MRWAGSTYRDQVSVAYQRDVAAGPLRPPRPDERRELRPGDEGLVADLLVVDQASGQARYVLRFGDVELEATVAAATCSPRPCGQPRLQLRDVARTRPAPRGRPPDGSPRMA